MPIYTRDEMDDMAEARWEEERDDRLTRGVCIRCEGPMPELFRAVSPKPAKCPACAPIQWLEFSGKAGEEPKA